MFRRFASPNTVFAALFAFAVPFFLVAAPLVNRLTTFAFAENVAEPIFVASDRPNEIVFEKTTAKFIRFSIFAWNEGDAPCVDEFQIFNGLETDETNNLARRSDVVASASSCIAGYAVHKIEHLNDARFGNDASWVAASSDQTPVLTFAWSEPVEFDRVVFSRDREKRFRDRVPTRFEIAVSDDGATWRSVWVNETSAFVAEPLVLADGFSQWFSANVPTGEPIEIALADAAQEPDKSASFPVLSQYDLQVRDGFLFEEIAWLKTAGFGDVEHRLRQRNYPEHVEPQIPAEDVLPLPVFTADSNLDADNIGRVASCGTVSTVASVDRWDAGPLLSQSASAALVGDELFLKISGNRFISRNLALIGVENAPIRALLVLRDDDSLVWKRLDATADGNVGEEMALGKTDEAGQIIKTDDSDDEFFGVFDRETATASVRIPVSWLPGLKMRGLAVGLGIGGRWTEPGGRPIHFVPTNFAISNVAPNANGAFHVNLTAVGAAPVELALSSASAPVGTFPPAENAAATWRETVQLEPGETKTVALPAQLGLVGPEFRLKIVDQTVQEINNDKTVPFAADFFNVLFEYDATRRPLELARELVERRTATDSSVVDRVHFEKRTSIPGVVNPIYTDVDAELKELANVADDLTFEPLAYAAPNVRAFAEKIARFEAERERLANSTQDEENAAIFAEKNAANRSLYYRIKLAKRDFFLTDENFSPLTKILFNKRNPFHPSHNYSDLFDSTWRPGGAVSTLTIPQTDEGRLEPEKARVDELIPAENGVVRNPSPSFDATKIYYAFRANQTEFYRIFEYDLTSKTSRRISPDGPFHDFWPTELPDGGLAFVSTRCKKKFICWRPQAFVLHRMDKDGLNVRELSHANLTEFAPSVKDDGRLIWTRSEYVDKGADYGHTLWTIRPDGTTPELVFGNTINLPQGYANGRDVPETGEVCCIAISHFGDLNGPILFLDVSKKGPNDAAAIRALTPEVPWPGAWAANETFREPFPITKDVVLVSWANRDRFGLWLVDRFGNREFLYADPTIDSVCAQPLQPRDVPPIRTSPIDPELAKQELGRFAVANVYVGLEGQVKPGSIKYLRICRELPANLEQNPDGTYRTDHDPFEEWYAAPTDVYRGAFGWPSYVAKGVVGTVEVAPDGSAEFYAPANQVLFFEALDENFNEIQRMRSVIQLQPGEQRSCVGCHESRLLAPQGSLTTAAKKTTSTPVPPPWGAGPFRYTEVVQPVLDKNCVECHSPETAAENPKKIDLTATVDERRIPNSYRSLLSSGTVHYFDYLWGGGLTTKAAPYSFGVSKSSLFQIIRDPNHKTVALKSEEEQALKCWIDLNVPLWGDYQQRSKREIAAPAVVSP